MLRRTWLALTLALLTATAQADSAQTLRALAADTKVRPSHDAEKVSPNSPLARLGRELFFTKALSLPGDVACASCHHPRLGGADRLSLPVEIGRAHV